MISTVFILTMILSLFLSKNPVFTVALATITVLFIVKEFYRIQFKKKATETLHSIYNAEARTKVSSIVNEVCYEYSQEGMKNTKRCDIEIYGREKKCSNC